MSAEIVDLIEVLRATDQRLDELLGGEVDTVMDRDGQTIVLRRAQGQLRQSEVVRQAAILEALPASIALLDARGVIVSVNAAWGRFGLTRMDSPGQAVGLNYLEICTRTQGEDGSENETAAGVRAVLEGRSNSFSIEYPCHSPVQRRWCLMTVTSLDESGGNGAVVMHTEITERKRAEEERYAAAQLLDSIIENIPIAVQLKSVRDDLRVVMWNKASEGIFGIPRSDALGRNVRDLWPAADADRMHASDLALLAGSGVQDFQDHPSPTRTRGRIVLHLRKVVLFDINGKATHVLVVADDATERKQAETALRESEVGFRALAESMPQIVWVTRPDGWNIYFNRRFVDYTGLSHEESVGYGWIKVLHPDDHARAREAWKQATATNSAYTTEGRLRRADGVYRWWLIRGIPQRDAAEGLVKWFGTSTDIDDLKLAEMEISRSNQELERQRTELQVLFDLVPALILFKDTNNRILRVNQRVAEAVNLPVEQIEGKCSSEIFPRDARRFYEADLEVIRSGVPKLGVVNSVQHPDGTEHWVQTDKVPYHDDKGEVIGLVILTRDISEHKRDQDALRDLNADLEVRVRSRTAELSLARNEAEQASMAKSDFLAAMSHEIRTPMSGLLGLLELLGLSTLDHEQHSTLSVARESGLALLHIIDDILDFSKIEANRLELHLVAASIKEVVENACRLHEPAASRKKLALQAQVAAPISPLLLFDPLRLGQILNNFLNNAIKFTESGTVDLRVELVERGDGKERLRFVVRDTGIGMSPEQLGRLFQPFAQAGAEISARFGGTGLGLVISRRLAELMGGTVEIQSELGRGTTLILSMALEVCESGASIPPRNSMGREVLDALTAGRRAAPTIQEAEADGSLLLVVDDHPTNRMVLLRQVASLGYAAEAAIDGIEALQAWKSGRFGAVITDCNMPRMNGYELAKAIRLEEGQSDGRRVPIIACTANASSAAAEMCVGAGMDDCMVKPADLAEIGRKLDWWLPVHHPGLGEMGPPPMQFLNSRPPLSQAGGLLDVGLLHEISGGDVQAQARMLADFRRVNELDAAALRQAAACDEFPKVVDYAHRIKGASLMLGATLLSGVCARVESAGAAKDPAVLHTAMGTFETELLRLNNYLDTLS